MSKYKGYYDPFFLADFCFVEKYNTSYELRVQIDKIQIQIHKLRIQIYELRIQIYELRV